MGKCKKLSKILENSNDKRIVGVYRDTINGEQAYCALGVIYKFVKKNKIDKNSRYPELDKRIYVEDLSRISNKYIRTTLINAFECNYNSGLRLDSLIIYLNDSLNLSFKETAEVVKELGY